MRATMKDISWKLGEKFLKEGANLDVVKESQELDIIIVEKQKLLLKKYLENKNKLATLE